MTNGSAHKKNTVAALWLARTSLSQSNKEKSHGRLFTVLLFAFIVLFLLILLTIGIQVYSAINDSREQGDESRLGLSMIANNIRMSDQVGAIGIGQGPEGDSLVMTEALEVGSYETRIYLYQGKIVEEYSEASKAYTPERAREIVASEEFSFDYTNDVITVHTDQGSVNVALRSTGGA